MTARVLLSGCPSEDAEQEALVVWIRTWQPSVPELESFAAVPNGGSRAAKVDRSGRRYSPEAQRMLRMGVSPGYPDTLLDVAVAPFHGLRIELKSLEGSPSPEQRAWLERLRQRGYRAEWRRGWLAAARLIVDYLTPVLDPALRARLWRSIPAS